MKFCSKCNGIMKPYETNKLICVNCNNIEEGTIASSTKIKEKEKKGKGFVEDNNMFADYEFVCKKCGHNKAQVIMRPAYISDENDPVYLKCGKCGNTKQIARKVM